MAAKNDLIISTNPAVGVHREGRIDLGLARHRRDAAQALMPRGESRLALTLRLIPTSTSASAG
jgi:hypothetical protein